MQLYLMQHGEARPKEPLSGRAQLSGRYRELRRKLQQDEYEQAVAIAREACLSRLDERHPHPLLRERLLAV